MSKLCSVGDRTELCSISACLSLGVDIFPSTETLNFVCERNELKSISRQVENSSLDNLRSKSGCNIVSKAFSISKNTAAVNILLLKLIYNLNQRSKYTFYKLMLWLLQCLDGESSSGTSNQVNWPVSFKSSVFFYCFEERVFVGFESSVMFAGWHLVRMICLDRRVVLHWKHTMVHLLSFWGS
jgi:hypothetical protein